MKCFICQGPVIWGGDNDADHEEFLLETNYSCQKCDAVFLVFHGKLETIEEDDT